MATTLGETPCAISLRADDAGRCLATGAVISVRRDFIPEKM